MSSFLFASVYRYRSLVVLFVVSALIISYVVQRDEYMSVVSKGTYSKVEVQKKMFSQYPVRTLTVNNKTLFVWVANTVDRRTRGLSGSEYLPPGTGMLFVFDSPGIYGFWMFDMQYPIDIIWLDEQFNPVYRVDNISPETYPEIFTPPIPVRYVIETNPGEIPTN